MSKKLFDELDALISDMAKAMGNLEEQEKTLEEIRAEIPQLGKTEENIKYLKKNIREFDQWIRETAISLYRETGEKKLHPAVQIKTYTGILYDEDKAIEWAEKNAPIMLKTVLDSKQFESYMKSQSESDRPDFVIVDDDPKPNISKAEIKKLAEAKVEHSDVPF